MRRFVLVLALLGPMAASARPHLLEAADWGVLRSAPRGEADPLRENLIRELTELREDEPSFTFGIVFTSIGAGLTLGGVLLVAWGVAAANTLAGVIIFILAATFGVIVGAAGLVFLTIGLVTLIVNGVKNATWAARLEEAERRLKDHDERARAAPPPPVELPPPPPPLEVPPGVERLVVPMLQLARF